MRIVQEGILRQGVAIRRDSLLFPLEIFEQDGEVECQIELDVFACRYNRSASLSCPSRCSNRPRLILASR